MSDDDNNHASGSEASEAEEMEEEVSESERMKIREEISSMSFEDLIKLKEKIGCKLYNQKVFGASNKKPNKIFKRANKNRPREMSSKIRPKSNSLVVAPKKVQSRDPRFDPICGAFEDKEFKNNYGFLKEIRIKEKKQLEEELTKAKDANSRKTVKGLIQRLENQIREQEKREKQENEMLQEKREIKEKLMKGEKPQFKKKSVRKIESFINQYEDLKKQNKLDKHIDKRSKKISRKELRNINKAL